jgi:2-C-methyl-D-erythritol 4-phosphate cytidylyltransferase
MTPFPLLMFHQVIRDAQEHGAAVLAVPMKATVKESADGEFVLRTIDRSRLWEIHTPQVMHPLSVYVRQRVASAV